MALSIHSPFFLIHGQVPTLPSLFCTQVTKGTRSGERAIKRSPVWYRGTSGKLPE